MNIERQAVAVKAVDFLFVSSLQSLTTFSVYACAFGGGIFIHYIISSDSTS